MWVTKIGCGRLMRNKQSHCSGLILKSASFQFDSPIHTLVVMYIFRTGPNGPDQTEGIKFGPDRTRFAYNAHVL